MNAPRTDRSRLWGERVRRIGERLGDSRGLVVEGTLTRMVGLTLEAVGCRAAIGGHCDVINSRGERVEAEVVGFAGESLYLMPTGDIRGLEPDARVVPTGRMSDAPVGDGLLGRIIDGSGKPLDGRGPIHARERWPLVGESINPLARDPIRKPLDVGIRAINALLGVGRGQRLGLFAGSGVGKSVLLGMMTKYTDADVVVVGLIGERGREVKEFVEPPLRRMHGAMQATSIAEFFRAEGRNVLLLMDSLTRFAQAQREIGLAINEPPATKGYPPSVFAKLPQLVERAGNGDRGGGSITAFYTVLVEGDDQSDPIADAARAILDGHIVLSRRLAEAGHYPAIDIEASVSRAMNEITSPEQQQAARDFKRLYSVYQQNRDLISVGAYQSGSDENIDLAISAMPSLETFLRQDQGRSFDLEQSIEDLLAMFPQERALTADLI
ncbi:MAG: FliI/YscN family ATPase [Gammaproteobacteria bacterium]